MDDFETRSRTVGPFVITVLARDDAQRYQPKGDGPAVLLSITDPGTPSPESAFEHGYRDVLRVSFHDAQHASLAVDVEPIQGYQAQAIACFILHNRRRYDQCQLVIHCESGVSRSAAVAAAVSRFLGDTVDERYFLGRPLVEWKVDLSEPVEPESPFYANERVYHVILRALCKEDTQQAEPPI